jgi:galactonate dehydratase
MRITDIKVLTMFARWKNWNFVKVETDEGIIGWGEATLEGKEKVAAQAVLELKRYLVKKDPFQIEHHWQNMYRDAFYSGMVLNTAISAVEQAMWDIIGKKLNQPIYNLLGGRMRSELKCYANAWYIGAKTLEDWARKARDTVKQGFRALKLDPCGASGLFMTEEAMKKAECIVAAVREAVGDGVDVMLEIHGRLSPHKAIVLANRLEKYNIAWYEEPVPFENLDALVKVARAIKLPIAAGERLTTKHEFRRLLEIQAADIIQPDLCHCGGILECKKIAAMAEAYYVGVAPHNANGPVSTAAATQIDACIPNFYIQEIFVDCLDLEREIVINPIQLENGCIKIQDRPGLGIDLDEGSVARHPYRPVDMNFMSRGMEWVSSPTEYE